ncbi:MAG: endolytic transglycosylase MltG [Candidatus Dormibacteria bacterium]
MRAHPVAAALLTILVLLMGAGAGLALLARNDLQPVSSQQTQKVLFSIAKGETLAQVANGLKRQKLVRSDLVFKLYAESQHLQRRLQPGRFPLDPGMSASEIVQVLKGPPLSQAFNVTIPDGLRASQEARLLQADGLFAASSYLALVDHTTAFAGIAPLSGTPPGAGWEGLAFGDTYQVLPKTTPYQMLRRQLQDFESRAAGKIDAGAAKVGLSPFQVLVLASIVSAEAATPSDRDLVAGVFFNRLHSGMALQSDVTVLYAQSLSGDDGAQVNTQFASPYNTYLHTGLPPGPIDSPGLTAIDAVLHPTATAYLYFLALPNGKVEYSVTLAQHNAQIQEAGLG